MNNRIQNIDEIEKKLAEHFSVLSDKRKNNSLPVFAFEHNLDKQEIIELVQHLNKQRYPRDTYWLCWIVLATEVGYEVNTTHKYWPIFNEKIPNFNEDDEDNRTSIRRFFVRFKKKYNGYKPLGPFAEKFTKISWPIYHSILPKRLRLEIARLVYYNATLIFDHKNNKDLGEVLSSRVLNGDYSKLFQQFALDEKLLANICLNLIRPSNLLSESKITKDVLKRINDDINEIREAKIYLDKSREKFQKTRISGFKKIPNISIRDKRKESTSLENQSNEIATKIGISGKFYLHKLGNQWELTMKIPSFNNFLKNYPEYNQVIQNENFYFNSEDKPIPAIKLKYGSLRFVFNEWPDVSKRIIEFNSLNEDDEYISDLNFLLDTTYLMTVGDKWLFIITDENLAQEIKGKSLRKNREYLLLTKTEIETKNFFQKCNSKLYNSFLYYFKTPKDEYDGATLKILEDINLSPNKTIFFEPIGIPPINFDSEGVSDWYEDDIPCFRIFIDHPINKFLLTFDNNEFPVPLENNMCLISMDKLDYGQYIIEAEAEIYNRNGDIETINNTHTLNILSKDSWKPGSRIDHILNIITKPYDINLDELMNQNGGISVEGPNSLNINIQLSLYEGKSEVEIYKKRFSDTLMLPISYEDWDNFLETKIKNDKNILEKIEQCDKAILTFSSSIIGNSRIELDRDFQALDWKVRCFGRKYSVNIINNKAEDAKIPLFYYSFNSPDLKQIIGYSDSKIEKEISGGLIQCKSIEGDEQLKILPKVIKNFDDFKITNSNLKKSYKQNSITDVLQLINLYIMWYRAKIYLREDNMRSREQINKILRKINEQLSILFCGEKFGQLEFILSKNTYGDRKNPHYMLNDLATCIQKHNRNNFPNDLFNLVKQSIDYSLEKKVQKFYFLHQKFLIDGNIEKELSKFALLLFFDPHQVLTKYDKVKFNTNIEKLLDNRTFTRSARFFVIAHDPLLIHRAKLQEKIINPSYIPYQYSWKN